MTTSSIRYIGTEPLREESITGSKRVWDYGQIQTVDTAIATQLMTTGLFEDDAGVYAQLATDSSGNVTGLVGPGGTLAPIPVVLAQTAIPVIIVPNGTVATNGTITLGTALPTTYANAWVYLPAGAVVGGLAGLYFATFSSTTVGVITTTYNSLAAAFTPYIATGTVVATGSNSAYTQTTGEVSFVNVTVPGGLMGANGEIYLRGTLFSANTTAGNKSLRVRINGSLEVSGSIITSSGGARLIGQFQNRGVVASQVTTAYGGPPNYTAVNTAVNQPLTITGQLTVATDCIVLEGFTVEVLPKA